MTRDPDTFDDLDDYVGQWAAFNRRDLAATFDYLAAVVEARFAVIRAGLGMTLEQIR